MRTTTGRWIRPVGRRELPAVLAGVAYAAKARIAEVPALALPFARVRGRGEVISRDTDVVIESFPRCASSFAVAAFRLAQEPRAMRIANHTHMPAQVLVAARRGVPALVLMRDPEAAVLSHVIHTPTVYDHRLAARVRPVPRTAAARAGRVRRRRVRGGRGRLRAVIRRMNERFGTSFTPFEHTAANLERLSREIDSDYRSRARSADELERIIPRPSASREVLKDRLREEYRRAPADLRGRAERAFERLRPG